MIKYAAIFLLTTLFFSNPLQAQFTSIQEDSVLNQLSFTSASYEFRFNYVPSDYQEAKTPNPFEKLSDEQILAKVKNHYTDASIYKHLCLVYFLEKKDMAMAEKYYQLAIPLYETWLNEDAKNPELWLEILNFLYSTKSYANIKQVLENALTTFPTNLEMMQYAVILYLDVFRDFDNAQKYIQSIFEIEPYNLVACTYQVMLYQYQYLTSLNQNENSLPNIDISIAEKALKAKPNEIAYQHLYHFAKVIKTYMSAMGNFVKSNTDADMDYNLVFKALDKDQIKIMKDAEKFFKLQLNKQKKARKTIMNSLGFIAMFTDQRAEAKKYFQMYKDEFKDYDALQSLILLSFLNKEWIEMEKLLEKSLQEFNDIKAYSSLMSLYDKYLIDNKKKLQTIQAIEKLPNPDEYCYISLCTWYLKQKNISEATRLMAFLNPESESALWRNLALYVLKDDKTNAKLYLDKIKERTPNDKDILMLQGVLGF